MKPGTALQKVIPDFFKSPGCGCTGYARKMDKWGVEGCRERSDEIVAYLVSKAREIGWMVVVPEIILTEMATRWLNRAIGMST